MVVYDGAAVAPGREILRRSSAAQKLHAGFLDHRKVKMRGSHRRSICGIITRRLCRARCSRLSGGNSTAGRQTAKPAADPSARYWCSGKVVCGRCGSRFQCRAGRTGGRRSAMGVGKRVHGVAACAAPAVGNRILLDCMKQIIQDLPIDMEMVLRQTLRAIPDLYTR